MKESLKIFDIICFLSLSGIILVYTFLFLDMIYTDAQLQKLNYLATSIQNTIKREGYLSEYEYRYFKSIIEHNDNEVNLNEKD